MTTPLRNKGGAPKGNQNRLVHGKYTREMVEFRRRVREHLREVRTKIAETRTLLGRAPESGVIARNHNKVCHGPRMRAAR
jgi:Ni,Fe-hydrogenase III large subunit